MSAYTTKEEALSHLSSNQASARKQAAIIEKLYSVGLTVTQSELDGMDYDCHTDAMTKAMAY